MFKAFALLQKKRVRDAALYQAARLFELLPSAANDLWQADVTYLHIPGQGLWGNRAKLLAIAIVASLLPATVGAQLFVGAGASQ